jgi:hypothetical protein
LLLGCSDRRWVRHSLPARPGDHSRPADHHVALLHRNPWGPPACCREPMGASVRAVQETGEHPVPDPQDCATGRGAQQRASNLDTRLSLRRRFVAANLLVGQSPSLRCRKDGVIGPENALFRRRPAHVEPDSATPLSLSEPRPDRAERPERLHKGLKSRPFVSDLRGEVAQCTAQQWSNPSSTQ